MQKILLLFLFSCFCFTNAKSQASVRFCATVYQNGECVMQNTKFFSTPDSITQKVSLLATNLQGFATDSLFFEMKSIDKNGVENSILHYLTGSKKIGFMYGKRCILIRQADIRYVF
jgi:hypothetical protein